VSRELADLTALVAERDQAAAQLPDPSAVQATDDEIEALRAGQLPSNADAVARMLAAWSADIRRGTAA
jgi:hypothetical protein